MNFNASPYKSSKTSRSNFLMKHATDSVLHYALASSFGDYEVVESFRPLRKLRKPIPHVLKGTIVARGSPVSLVLKLRNPRREGSTLPTNLRSEAVSLQHCELVGIPSPRLIGFDANHEWLLLSYVPGTTIERSSLGRGGSLTIERLGELLALIHGDKLVAALKDDLQSEDSHARLAILDSNLRSLPRTKVTSKMAELLARLGKAAPPKEDLAFTHGDFSGDNVLLTDKIELHVLDWEAARFSPRGVDVAFASSSYSGFCRDGNDAALLLASYQHHAGKTLETFAFYKAVCLIEQAINGLSNGESVSTTFLADAVEQTGVL